MVERTAGGRGDAGTPLISIVVSCYDISRLTDLFRLLDSISMQTSSVEVVLVVERDRMLYESAVGYMEGLTCWWTAVFSPARLGISNARNLGVGNCTGRLIAFIDDDAILFEDWSNQVRKALEKYPNASGFTGSVVPLTSGANLDWFPKSLYWMIGCTGWREVAEGEVDSVSGANMMFKHEIFKVVSFVDEFSDGSSKAGKQGTTGDDVDFVLRVRMQLHATLVFFPSIRVFHRVYPFKLTYRYIRRYAFWQGVAEARYDATYGRVSRQASRSVALQNSLADLTKGPARAASRRAMALLTFVCFGALGFYASQRGLTRVFARLV